MNVNLFAFPYKTTSEYWSWLTLGSPRKRYQETPSKRPVTHRIMWVSVHVVKLCSVLHWFLNTERISYYVTITRGRVHMTYAKFWEFLTPSLPLVRIQQLVDILVYTKDYRVLNYTIKFTQPPSLCLLLGDPLPMHCRHHVYMSPNTGMCKNLKQQIL